jgi:TonB family protein
MPVLQKFEVSDQARTQFVFNIDDLDYTPSPYYRKRPIYPYQLRQESIEGRVVAEFQVDRDGHTYDIRITESDHPEFSASVADALLKWRFMPGLVAGEPVEFRMRIPMMFRIVMGQPAEPELFIASVD